MKTKFSSWVILFMLVSNYCISQISEGGTPLSIESNNRLRDSHTELLEGIPLIALDKIDNSKEIERVGKLNDSCKTCRSDYYGTGLDVKIDLLKEARVIIIPEGKLYLLKVSSDNAYALQFYFNKYKLPQGAKLYFYNELQTMVLGAFTSNNNHSNGQFATQPISGSLITIEYFEPHNAVFKAEIEIYKLIHCFIDLFDSMKDKSTQEAPDVSCAVDVNCSQGANYSLEKKAVCLLLRYFDAQDLAGFCSGALINSTETIRKGYILTANHCVDPKSLGNNDPSYFYSNWIFLFNYQKTCNSYNDAPTSQSIQGASLLTRGEKSDYALLDLGNDPSLFYDVVYLGWDIRTGSASLPSKTICISHPGGLLKKIAIDNDAPKPVTWTGSEEEGGVGSDHYRVSWNTGITQRGSSGSPLIRKDGNTIGKIIGQLHGGFSTCSTPTKPDYFGTLFTSWNNPLTGTLGYPQLYPSLSFYLNPPNTPQVLVLDGYKPSGGDNGPSQCYIDNPNAPLVMINNITPDQQYWQASNSQNPQVSMSITTNPSTSNVSYYWKVLSTTDYPNGVPADFVINLGPTYYYCVLNLSKYPPSSFPYSITIQGKAVNNNSGNCASMNKTIRVLKGLDPSMLWLHNNGAIDGFCQELISPGSNFPLGNKWNIVSGNVMGGERLTLGYNAGVAYYFPITLQKNTVYSVSLKIASSARSWYDDSKIVFYLTNQLPINGYLGPRPTLPSSRQYIGYFNLVATGVNNYNPINYEPRFSTYKFNFTTNGDYNQLYLYNSGYPIFFHFDDFSFKAAQKVTQSDFELCNLPATISADYKAISITNCNYAVIADFNRVTATARDKITLSPGFVATQGAFFDARIDEVSFSPCSITRTTAHEIVYDSLNISEYEEQQQIIVYPNPTTGLLSIKTSEDHNHTSRIIIYNALGTQVKKIDHFYAGQIFTVDLSDQSSGLYLLKFIRDNYVEEHRLFLEK